MNELPNYMDFTDDIRKFVANEITLYKLISEHRGEIDYEGSFEIEYEDFFAELCYHIRLHEDDLALDISEINENFESGKFSKKLKCKDLCLTKNLEQYINRMLLFFENNSVVKQKKSNNLLMGSGVIIYAVSLTFFAIKTDNFLYAYGINTLISGILFFLYFTFNYYRTKPLQKKQVLAPFDNFKDLSNFRRANSFNKIILKTNSEKPKLNESVSFFEMLFLGFYFGLLLPKILLIAITENDEDSFKLKSYNN